MLSFRRATTGAASCLRRCRWLCWSNPSFTTRHAAGRSRVLCFAHLCSCESLLHYVRTRSSRTAAPAPRAPLVESILEIRSHRELCSERSVAARPACSVRAAGPLLRRLFARSSVAARASVSPQAKLPPSRSHCSHRAQRKLCSCPRLVRSHDFIRAARPDLHSAVLRSYRRNNVRGRLAVQATAQTCTVVARGADSPQTVQRAWMMPRGTPHVVRMLVGVLSSATSYAQSVTAAWRSA